MALKKSLLYSLFKGGTTACMLHFWEEKSSQTANKSCCLTSPSKLANTSGLLHSYMSSATESLLYRSHFELWQNGLIFWDSV